nr:hypothetical protein [Tanacetum cinerariifolium]
NINTAQAQQKAIDDALVAYADHPKFEKCNMRLKIDIKPKTATFHVVLGALALTPFYRTFLITVDVPSIYMQEFWVTVSIYKSSIRFTINKKKVSLDVDMFREIIQFCCKIPGQKFEDFPLEHDILSFIRDLGHSGDITYLTDVNLDYLHQPWRAFATIINKCLSGKETGIDKIRLSHAQILWKTPKPKYVRKKADYGTSPKKKLVQATKVTRIKTKAKVAKFDKKKQPAKKLKAKGLNVLYKVALTEVEQLKLATKEARHNFIVLTQVAQVMELILNQRFLMSNNKIFLVQMKELDDFEDDADINDDASDDNDEKEEYDDEFNVEEGEKMDEEEDNEVTKELYKDVNVNLGNTDVDHSGADQKNASE